MGSSNVSCRPLLRYLFQNEDKIYKELDAYFNQDGSLPIISQLSLSSEAFISLKEKLLTYPQEAACILHQLAVINRQIRVRRDTQQNALSTVDRASSHKEYKVSNNPEDLNQLKRIFIECLDHCLRRVENLDEKLQKEREEYSEVLKRQQKSSSSRSTLGVAKQGTIESKEAQRLKERTVATNMEKLRNETLFYRIFSLTADVGVTAMNELFPRMLRLCYERNLLAASRIHFSLLSSSGDCLQLFCEREGEYLFTKSRTKKLEQSKGTLSISSPDARQFFHISAKSRKHVLEILFELMISNPTASLTEIEMCEESEWLVPFWPLLFIQTMSASPDKIADLSNVAVVWEKHSVVVDPLLMKVCTDLSRDMKLVAWCLTQNSRIKTLPLLQLIRDHSPLYALHKSLPLHTLVPSEVLELLREHCMAKDDSGNLSFYCKSTYMAFCILSKVFEVIGAGMQLDNIAAGWQARGKLYPGKRLGFAGNNDFQDRESPASFYKLNIAEKLKAIQSMLNDLHPLKYRLEVMENMYSLIFVKHSDMSDEGQSESGGEEGELERSFISQQTDDSAASTSHTATPQRPRSPQKSSFSASEKTGDSKMYKVINFSDYVVVSERFREEENFPDESSNISSVSGDERPSRSSSTEGSDKNMQSATDAITDVKLCASSWTSEVSEQLPWDNDQQLSHGGPAANQSSCAMSGKSTGSSVSELPRTGYLINTLVAWDMLILLRDSLLAFSADSYKKFSQAPSHEENISRQHFQNQISYLSRSINEGLWRLQLMAPCSHTFASLDVFDIYLNGTLLSNTVDCLVYENFSGLESTLYKSSSYGEGGSTQGARKRPAKDTESVEAIGSSECIGVINFLFASPSNLITLALSNGNLGRVEQIFQIFKVPDTLEKREALLAVRLNELRPKLSVTSHKSGRIKEAKVIQASCNSQNMLQNIGLLAREGSAQVGSTNLIHDLVTSSPPPIPKGIPEAALESGCPVMASFLTPKALVLTDLALTVDVTETTATYLMEQALQIQTTENLTHKHSGISTNIQGYIPVLQQMGSICNVIIDMRKPKDNDSDDNMGKDIAEYVLFHFFDQPATPFSIFLSSFPLKAVDVKNYINGLSRVLGSIYVAEEAISNAAKEDQENVDTSIHSQKNHIHLSYKRLLHVMSEESSHLYPSSVREKSDAKLGAFVRSFYHYLQLLSAMVAHHANKTFLKDIRSYFCLLTQRPVHILGSLMFKEGVDPIRLEPLAARMRLSLTAMILQYCCPKFTIPREKLCGTVCSSMRDKASMLGFLVMEKWVIMNAGAMLCKAGVYGEVVVRDILMSLLSGLHEAIQPVAISSKTNLKAVILNDATAPNTLSSVDVLMALKDTADLAAVDFKKMVPGSEAVVFFINLANLMYIHAGILNHILYPGNKLSSKSRGIFSEYQLERIIAMKRFGYVIGQLGFLSLYDVMYSILSLHNPLSSILVQNDGEHKISICDSSLIGNRIHPSKRNEILKISELLVLPSKVTFCITQGTPVSPRVQVVHADRLEEQVDAGFQEHLRLFLQMLEHRRLKPDLDLNHTTDLSVRPNKCCLLTSRTVLDYLALDADSLSVGIQSLRENTSDDLASTLRRLESELSKSRQLEVTVLDRNEEKGIALEYIEAFADENSAFVAHDESEASNISDTSDDLPWLPVKVPHTVLTYLRKQCPLLAFIVQAFHSSSEINKRSSQAWMDDAADTWLNILYPPSMGIKPPVEETKVFQAIRNLFSIDRHKALAKIYEGNKVASALSCDPNIISIWYLADDLLGSNAITKDYHSSLPCHVADLVTVLQALPTHTLEKYPDLVILLDHLLVFLVQSADSAADPAPWMFAHQISDNDMRYALVMETHREWPASAAVDLLNLVAHDTKLPCHLQDLARKRAEQIEVYEKILVLGNQSCRSWQEVELMSKERPAELLQYLVQKKQFRLSVQWADYHRGSAELRRLVDQSYLMDVLDKTTPDYNVASEALRTLNTKDLAIVTQDLLQKLSSIPTRRFLIDFFLNNYFSEETNTKCIQNNENEEKSTIQQDLSAEKCNLKELFGVQLDVATLQQEVMGLILVEDVAPPASDRFQLSHLTSAPHLIIEQWLMNIRLEVIEKTVKVLGHHLDKIDLKMPLTVHSLNLKISGSDTPVQTRKPQGLSWDVFNWLLEVYAAKALDTSGVQLAVKPQPVSEKSPRKFVMPPQPPERHEWVPDGDVRKCPVCEVALFSMFCRRHHCRRCGRVVCGSCSQYRNIVQGYGNLLVRVCFDCYQQTKELNLQDYIQVRPLGDGAYDTLSQDSDTQSTRGGTSLTSDTEGGWYLSTDSHHNDLIRQEFCYDYAPSISLCLAILAQHQDHKQAAVCIVKFCHRLFSLLISSLKLPSPEANQSFVLSMIQTLLTSAKVRFGNVSEHQGIGFCEYYTHWVDLLSLLLKANCGHIIPLEVLENMLLIGDLHLKNLMREDVQTNLEKQMQQEFFHMRHLRDKLVKKQMWELALNVSTKAGLETNGVWGAWAMASLKAGDFPGARERFSRVLERPLDKNRACKPSLLPEVIKYLESNPFRIDQKVMDRAERTRSSIILSDQTRLPPSQSLVVLHTLQNLENIAQGNLIGKDIHRQPFQDQRSKTVNVYRIESVFQIESRYYLTLYGNHTMTIQYFMRNKQVQECVEYLLAEDVSIEIFTEEVLVPCLRCGQLDCLMKYLYASDPRMDKWAKLMVGSCHWLERRGWWNCLLTVQEAVGDRVRAAMTLLRLYKNDVKSYSVLSNRSEYIESARQHLQTYLDSQALYRSIAKRNNLILSMSPWHLNESIVMLTLQIDVMKFISSNEVGEHHIEASLKSLYEMEVLQNGCLPTLLQYDDERLAVAIIVVCGAKVLADGLNLAYRIVERNNVSVKKLLSICCQLLVKSDRVDTVGNLVKGIKDWEILTLEVIDVALHPAIQTVANNNQNAYLDVLVKLLSSDKAKMEAYISCGRLKSAYLVAVHDGCHEDVERVQEVALLKGQVHVATMCSKWLTNYLSCINAS